MPREPFDGDPPRPRTVDVDPDEPPPSDPTGLVVFAGIGGRVGGRVGGSVGGSAGTSGAATFALSRASRDVPRGGNLDFRRSLLLCDSVESGLGELNEEGPAPGSGEGIRAGVIFPDEAMLGDAPWNEET